MSDTTTTFQPGVCCTRCGSEVRLPLCPQLAVDSGPLCPECQLDERPFQSLKSLLYSDLAEMFRYYR